MTAYNVTIAPEVRKKIEKTLKRNPTKKEKVNNALEVLKNHGPEYPSLQTHVFHGIKNPKTYTSYVENNTPGAWRILWHWGDGDIEIDSIGPHY